MTDGSSRVLADGARGMQQNSGARFDITIAGELNLDLILSAVPEVLPPERELIVDDFALTLGSSSAILAHNLAVLGSRVGFISRIGPDEFGAICCERLEQAGVDISRISRSNSGKATGLSLLLPFPNSNSRRILTYLGAMSEMSKEDVDEKYVAEGRHFHLSSFFLHQKLMPHIPELFASMKAKGLTTSLDTNDDPADEWGELLHCTLPAVDVLLCNEREVRKIADIDDLDAAAEKLAKAVPLVVVKCGARGARAFWGKSQLHADGISGDVVDTVGAGDSFNAGFLHRWVRGEALDRCMAFGNVTGALSTTRRGGTEAFRDSNHFARFIELHSNNPSMASRGR